MMVHSVNIKSKPIMRFRGFTVYLAKRHFSNFAGANSFDKVIVVSPRFLKLNGEVKKKILDHEAEECAFFDKHLFGLEQRAHQYACRKVGFPTREFAVYARGGHTNVVKECLEMLGVR